MIRTSLALLALVVASVQPLRAATAKLILLPPDNISGSDAAVRAIQPLIEKSLGDRGWAQVESKLIDGQLEASRVRYLDSLDPEFASKLIETTGADGFVATTVMSWRDGDNPIVSISARFIDARSVTVWGDAVAISSDDTETMLGFGRKTTVEALAAKAVGELLDSFPRPERDSRVIRGERKPLLRRGPRTYRSAELGAGEKHRVAILPFESSSEQRDAVRIVQELLAIRLLSTGKFDVVEPAVFRAAMREEKIRTFRGITPADMQRLAKRLGTSLFLKGTIYGYKEVPLRGSKVTPEVQLELTLVDVESAHILWTAHHDRKGDDYLGLLLRGATSNAVALADRVISEMIAAEQGARLRQVPHASTDTKGKPK